MHYKISAANEDFLLHQPETGMGYQILNACKSGSNTPENYIALNSQIIIPLNGYEDIYIGKVIKEGIFKIKLISPELNFNNIVVLNENQYVSLVGGSKTQNGESASKNPVVNASGDEIFVRLSAFRNDRRIDETNKCLRPGSFATTQDEYLACKSAGYDLDKRYSLPYNNLIIVEYHIKPLKSDTLQLGIVAPANNKPGGGEVAYFANGIAKGTFLMQTTY